MADFEQSIQNLLRGALEAKGHIRGYTFSNDAASFLAQRAYRNIASRHRERETILRVAIEASGNLSPFFERIGRRFYGPGLLIESAAVNIVNTRTEDCYFPWCSQ